MFTPIQSNQALQRETANVSNVLHETITGNRIVKAFTKEEYEGNRFARRIDKLFLLIMKIVEQGRPRRTPLPKK